MEIPSDTKIAKYRMKMQRAERDMKTAQDALAAARTDYDKNWALYLGRCMELGCCPVCNNKISECTCIALAKNT